MILVEGQMDCLSVFAAGIGNVIATSGTKFTEHQVRLLGRFTKRVVLSFDGDEPGIHAAETVLGPLVEEGFEVRVVVLPDGLDPDAFLKEKGLPAYAAMLRGAVPGTDFLIERARAQFGARTPEARRSRPGQPAWAARGAAVVRISDACLRNAAMRPTPWVPHSARWARVPTNPAPEAPLRRRL